MIRINVVAEGQSEMYFAKRVLNNYFNGTRIVNSRCVLTSTNRQTNYEYRGGMSTYQRAKDDIVRWLLEDQSAYVTTMFDYYQLPTDFPGYATAMGFDDHKQSIEYLEKELHADIIQQVPYRLQNHFIPYIQLHEFEALLFTDLTVLECEYLEDKDKQALNTLRRETKDLAPEEINNGPETAPSKRLLNALAYRKGSAPALWLELITINRIRMKCPHFAAWIDALNDLTEDV